MIVHVQDNCDYDQLVYVLSHDLRAPARALRQYVILLREEVGTDVNPDATRFMDRLNLVLDRMDERLDAILVLSRLGRPRTELGEQDYAPIFEAALAERNLKGTVGPMPKVMGDVGRMQYIAEQLLDNVVHHAGDGATVDISHDGERFWIKDDGPGIAKRVHDEVFVVFRPVPYPDSGRAGMGLSCVSRALRSLGGEIGIDLPDEGGTHVHFSLPLTP